jgi:hypothetical protein
LKFLGHRIILGSRPAIPFREIAELTGMTINKVHTKEKRLMPKLIDNYAQARGNDVSIGLPHIFPHRAFRAILSNPTPADIAYLQTTYSEHYLYHDVNDRELLVFLMVPETVAFTNELTQFLDTQKDRISIAGFSSGLVWKHLFNYADLAGEFDYDQNKWRDPFRDPTRWNWMRDPRNPVL